jgi:hypothetical protein
VNTGGGAGGGGGVSANSAGYSGGSGIVVVQYDAVLGVTVGAGLTSSSSTTGSLTTLTITAGTDTVTFN